jgi:hypothetical protein
MPLRNVRKWSRYLRKTAFAGQGRHVERRLLRAAQKSGNTESDVNRVRKELNRNSARPGKGIQLARKLIVETALRNQQINKLVSAYQYPRLKKLAIRLLYLAHLEKEAEERLHGKYGKNLPMDEQLQLQKISKTIIDCLNEMEETCGSRREQLEHFLHELHELADIASQAF